MCVCWGGGRGDECYLGKSQMSIDAVQRDRERESHYISVSLFELKFMIEHKLLRSKHVNSCFLF